MTSSSNTRLKQDRFDDRSWITDHDPALSLKRDIGSGGFGDVFEVLDKTNGKLFARKIVRLVDRRATESFEAEVRAVSKLCPVGAHDNIVAVLRHGFLNNSLYGFFDMELCQLNLDAYIRSERDPSLLQQMQYLTITKETKLVKAMSIMMQIADGVAYIHRKQEVHRDLKPPNVLYSHNDNAWKIADFGLTKAGTSKTLLTTKGASGTEGYRAPELLRDMKYNNKVDIFAMGCILYELVCGQKAFRNDFDVREWSFGHEEKRLPDHDLPQELAIDTISNLVARSLRREPSDRPSSKEVCGILRAFLGHSDSTIGPSPTASPPDKAETLQNWRRVRSHLPPWLNLDTKMPILCHEIQLLLRLTGRDSESNALATISTSAQCILFENILLFAQGSFPVIFDETAAPTMPNLTCFGMVFLENLNPRGTLSQMSSSTGGLSFIINLGHGNSIKFKFTSSDSTWISKSWYHTLQTCLQPSVSQNGADSTYLKPPFNIHEIAGGSTVVRLSFAMLEPSMSPLNTTNKDINLLEIGNDKPSPKMQSLLRSAARRLRVLEKVVHSFWEISLQQQRGGKYKWETFLASTFAVQALLKGIENVEEKEVPLHWAAYLGFRDLVKSLLEAKAILGQGNLVKEAALHLATQGGATEVVELLLKASPNLEVRDEEGRTVLHHAATSGQLQIATLLIDANEDLVSKSDQFGYTPLHLAARRGEIEVAKLLLDSGAIPSRKSNQHGSTALHCAARYGHSEVVAILLNADRKSAEIAMSDGTTALHLASQSNHPKVVSLLLKRNVNVNAKDFQGKTALHLAAQNGNREVVVQLLEGGAISLKDSRGDSPQNMASRSNHQDVVDVLQNINKRKPSVSRSGSIFRLGKKR